MGILSSVSNFVRTNISGASADYLPTDDPRGKEVKDDLNKINDRVDKINQDVDRIGEESKLKPPSLNNFTDKELLLTGAASGAVVGGGLGLLDGVYSVAVDKVDPNIVSTKHDILLPTFKGQTETIVKDVDVKPVFNSNGDQISTRENLKGYNHTFTAQIDNKKVGDYSTQQSNPQHTANGSPLSEGLKGMIGGAVIGAALSGAVIVGRHLAGNQQPSDADSRPIEGEGKVIVVTTAGGALLGAGAGLVAGLQEQSHSQPIHLTWQEPVMEKTTIGQMTNDHYQSIFETENQSKIAKHDVVVDAPKMHHNLLLQSVPDMQDKSQDVAVQPRFSVAGEVIGAAVVGGVMGAAAGVAVNVLRRVL